MSLGYYYIQSEPNLWTVGTGTRKRGEENEWVAESDHSTPKAAADRVRFLHGGDTVLKAELDNLKAAASALLACAGKAEHWTPDEREGASYLRAALEGRRGTG